MTLGLCFKYTNPPKILLKTWSPTENYFKTFIYGIIQIYMPMVERVLLEAVCVKSQLSTLKHRCNAPPTPTLMIFNINYPLTNNGGVGYLQGILSNIKCEI